MHENNRYPNPWLSTSLLVLFCLSLTSLQLIGDDSGNSAVPWLNRIDDDIRELVHATTKEVPPYPLRDKKWLDVKNWPGELTLDGERYTLRLEVQR